MTSLAVPAPAGALRPITPSLAALVEAAARPRFAVEPAGRIAAAAGLVTAPPAGRSILPGPVTAAPRAPHPVPFAAVRALEGGGLRLLDATV